MGWGVAGRRGALDENRLTEESGKGSKSTVLIGISFCNEPARIIRGSSAVARAVSVRQ